ncbi:MAG TPA: MopE-related protein, partial [Candidatus Paceibacterota bacterium]|nr:MopE-related protein [Candidatus Paceibacterota bacterium]
MKTKILMITLILSLLVLPLVSSKDVVYVVKSNINAETNIINSLDKLGYTYDILEESNIIKTNFSEYRLIIIGDSSFSPIYKEKLGELMTKHNTVIVNSKYYYRTGLDYQWGWSLNKATISSPSKLRNNVDLENTIDDGVDLVFNAYSVTSPDVTAYVLAGKKPSDLNIITFKDGGTTADSLVAYAETGVKLLNGKTLESRGLFFGVTNSQYWTENTKKLFENSLMWAIQYPVADLDSDGYCKAGYEIINSTAQCANEVGSIGTDCADGNNLINPGAIEIPYNNVDENCDGYDIADVDLDGYCQYGYIITNEELQCINELGSIGTDCDDNNGNINLGSSDLTINCKNDAPVQLNDIEDQSWEEDSSKV